MEHLGISRRTAFRLLEAFQELGFPLIDEQSRAGVEKTYRLMDSYIVKLPNIAMPNPGLTGEEIELIISILDFFDTLQQVDNISIIASIRQKILAMKSRTAQTKGS
jgi:predicted DNA-binding transcriptional regulator YafY